nr:12182_t:CDS:2 [Entrophospora candida]
MSSNFRKLEFAQDQQQLLESNFIDLASDKLGSKIIECSDEFFADASNLLKPEKAIRIFGKYTVSDYYFRAVIKLGFPGYVNGFDIDTSHFIGNHAPFADVEGCCMIDKDPIHNDHAKWDKMLDKVGLGSNAQHFFGISGNPQKYYTHIKINIYPDGGVARFRVYGTVFASFPKNPTELFDLAFVGNGGAISSYSDQHFGKVSDLLLPGRGNKNMSDGWETRRSREPKHKDWCIVKLGCPGYLEKVEVDTAYFKGNYPDSVELEGCFSGNPEISDLKSKWTIILPKTKLFPHKQHYFDLLKLDGKISHVRMNIYPDGGVKRLRIWGRREIPRIEPDSKLILSPSLNNITEDWLNIIITAEPLTMSSYSKYGNVIQSASEQQQQSWLSSSPSVTLTYQGIKVTSANQGEQNKKYSIAQPNLSIFKCQPIKNIPFKLDLLERHLYSSQLFVPMNSGNLRGYLIIVCLNGLDDKPDLRTLKAFVASNVQGVSYNPGTWHRPIIALEHVTDFICLTYESGVPDEDCEEVLILDNITIQVPGFNGININNQINTPEWVKIYNDNTNIS